MKIVKSKADKNSSKKVENLELATGSAGLVTVSGKGEFSFRINNAQTADQDAKRIAINPGRFNSVSEMSAYGLSADAILTDGEIITDGVNGDVNVYSKDSQLTVEQFVRYLREAHFRLEQIILSGDNEDVFEQQLTFTMNTPFTKPNVENINMSGWADEYQNNSKKSTVDLVNENKVMVLNQHSVLVWPIPANTNLNITFKGTWVRQQPSL